MKIVINKCYGGFGLSPKAVARLAELRGQKAYFFTGGFGSHPRVRVQPEEVKSLFWSAYNTETPGEQPKAEVWVRMSDEEKRRYNAGYTDEHIDSSPSNRTDPLLIQVVEELGEAANGHCAKLTIVEIPDDVKYTIEEYDGIESVHEEHRSWE